jgi:putative FmdB family regulatory protein
MSAVPLYEYECAKHGKFERIQKFSDPLLSTCPTCGRPVEKLLSSPAIQFKGTGWYVTDYARKGNDSSGKDGKGSNESKESKESKPSKESKDAKDSGTKSSDSKSESSPPSTTSSKGPASSSSSSK